MVYNSYDNIKFTHSPYSIYAHANGQGEAINLRILLYISSSFFNPICFVLKYILFGLYNLNSDIRIFELYNPTFTEMQN